MLRRLKRLEKIGKVGRVRSASLSGICWTVTEDFSAGSPDRRSVLANGESAS